MSVDLDKLERLHAAATPGPWKHEGIGNVCAGGFIADCMGLMVRSVKKMIQCKANADYIVAACNAVPELTAENRALRERVRELERQREWLAEFISNAFAGITPAKQFIEWAEESAKEAGE